MSAISVQAHNERGGPCAGLRTKEVYELKWLGEGVDHARLEAFGFREEGGGAHQSKTLMLKELSVLFGSISELDTDLRALIVEGNVLGKVTSSAAKSVFRNIVQLFGLSGPTLIAKTLFRLWNRDAQSRPQLALLAALSRDPLLRAGSEVVLGASPGTPVTWPIIAESIEARFPQRFSSKTLRSLAQNCASTWTQSGHLHGHAKVRVRVNAGPEAAAFAALIATVCGFSGPAILASPWFRVLDLSSEAAMDRLRSAEAQGLARVRAAGDVIEISVRRPLARTIGVPDLEHI